MISVGDVALRKLEERDAEQLYRFRNDRSIAESLVGFSTGYSRRDLVGWVEFHRNRTDEVLWAIAAPDDDRCIGHVGLYQVDHRVAKAEFAILIGDRDYWGRGIGTLLTSWVLDYGFQELNLHKVQLTVLGTNERARRIYEKLGFHVEGVLRADQYRDGRYIDTTVMSMLRDEWSSRKGRS